MAAASGKRRPEAVKAKAVAAHAYALIVHALEDFEPSQRRAYQYLLLLGTDAQRVQKLGHGHGNVGERRLAARGELGIEEGADWNELEFLADLAEKFLERCLTAADTSLFGPQPVVTSHGDQYEIAQNYDLDYMGFFVRLDKDALPVEAVSTWIVRALGDGVDLFTPLFKYGGKQELDSLHSTLSGGELENTVMVGDNVWLQHIRIPHLNRGQRHAITERRTFTSVGVPRSSLRIAPLWTIRYTVVRLDFPEGLIDEPFAFQGVPIHVTTETDLASGYRRPLAVNEPTYIEHRFSNKRVGPGYGIAWKWNT
jgi:hypothetical protein